MNDSLISELAPTGVLRCGLNMANFLLVNSRTAAGEPDGVSPDMARALARKLGVDATFVEFEGPGDVADAVVDDVWDIGNIAAEPERAKTVTFSRAYCEIQATYLIPAGSTVQSVGDIDAPGKRIAVKARAAYDLWLTDNLQHAELVRADSMDASCNVFVEKSLDALAGLRPKLVEESSNLPGSLVLADSFTAVQQSIGCHPGRSTAAAFIQEFVDDALASGLVAKLIDKHGVTGKLSPASRES